VDSFVLKVYQQSIKTILIAKTENTKEKLLEDELAKAVLSLGEHLYPVYLAELDYSLTEVQWNELGTYYGYYLFYLIGYSNFHLNQVIKKCLNSPHSRLINHPDCRLAIKLCVSLINLRYTPFFALISLCDSLQRKLLEPVSELFRLKALQIIINSYMQLPTSQVLCNLGFADSAELEKYINGIPRSIAISRRCPHFSPDSSTVLFRKK